MTSSSLEFRKLTEIVVLGEQRTEIGSIHIAKEEARRVHFAIRIQ